MSFGILNVVTFVAIVCAFQAQGNLCRKVERLLSLFPGSIQLEKPFAPLMVDGVAKLSPEEERFIGSWVGSVKFLAGQETSNLQSSAGDAHRYYAQFSRTRRPGQIVVGESDSRMVVEFPGANEIWSKLTPTGRLLITRMLASIHAKGKYELRNPKDSPVSVEDTGFSPVSLLGAADRGQECGECRLAASAVASLIGELGASPEDVRVASGDSHTWFEIRFEKGGEWWVVDATPGSETGRAYIVPLAKAGPPYDHAALDPFFLKPNIGRFQDPLLLERKGNNIIGLRYTAGNQTMEALESQKLYADTLEELIFTLPSQGNIAAILQSPDVKNVLGARYLRINLLGESLLSDGTVKLWSISEVKTVTALLAQSPHAGSLRELSLGDLPADRLIFDGLARDFPQLDRLEVSRGAGDLAQSSLLPRLRNLDLHISSELELKDMMHSLETGRGLQLQNIVFGKVRGISAETQMRVAEFQRLHPEIYIEVAFAPKPTLRR